MSDDVRKLTRQQLAAFIKDPRTLRAFEQMVTTISEATNIYQSIYTDPSDTAAQSQLIANSFIGFIDDTGSEIESLTAKLNSSLNEIQRLKDLVEFVSLAPAIQPVRCPIYGEFYDTTDQTAAAINTAYSITFNTTSKSNGIDIGSPTSRIYVRETGYFEITFCMQINKTTAAAGNFYYWARVNGSDVADSASKVTLQGSSAASMPTDHFNLHLNDGDYFELMFSVDDTGCKLLHIPASAPVPQVPSIVLSVLQIDR